MDGMPGKKDEFLQFARDRMQFLEDDVAASDRLQPFRNQSADEYHRIGSGHYWQVDAGRRSRHPASSHHDEDERVAADADDKYDRCAEDPQRGDQVETAVVRRRRRVDGNQRRRRRRGQCPGSRVT